MKTILVHGGLHGGWCWDQVPPPLRAEHICEIAAQLEQQDHRAAMGSVRCLRRSDGR